MSFQKRRSDCNVEYLKILSIIYSTKKDYIIGYKTDVLKFFTYYTDFFKCPYLLVERIPI